MKVKSFFAGFLLLSIISSQAQDENSKRDTLKEVIITSTRIELPFKKDSRTMIIINAEIIKNRAATNVADLLQQVAGVDIRRRGTGGAQADLYIRGGGFDQTLLLIDGIKMDDAQTGHHTLNAALPIEVIERIEIIKGSAARVFGQNAFSGAINIVTKKKLNAPISINAETGSFGQFNGSVTLGKEFSNSSLIVHAGALTSDGYRNNSDYNNYNYFLKGVFNKNKQPIEMIATFFDKKFGAENFYTTNPTFNEYEETQNSLMGVSTTFQTEKFKIKPRVYWRRGQDIFLLRRNNPEFYRNLHITNKVGVETNASYTSNVGITGFGIDVSRVSISSNNLGEHHRMMANVFLEHRFQLLDAKLDITPGVAITYFSDFKFHAFPGVDMGYQVSEAVKIYGNLGTTYRIPTYTDLYYRDPVTIGNQNLQPEEAFSQEIGVKFNRENFSGSMAFFNRDATNLIDYIRPNTSQSVFSANNITKVNTQGFELDANYNFKILGIYQTFAIGYSFLKDDILDQNKDLSRYSLNTLKHHFTTRFTSKILKNMTQNIIYKHAERITGQSYNVWDTSVILNLKMFDVTFTANNIFGTGYIESGFVPMPRSNVLFGLRFHM
ncbi:MAG: TonB-dependent receptor [Flavobacteriia bacterium]|nr:TonB-dependent receptor [Flavobacteriia bacterium]PIV95850.1 MAG: TonB-dependent receptor [Flavobacteriaceae bacterium CG17_big_fil_post_rev_8_21_14_2_50_31_13]PIX13994.1 MAG: TonB-dependent receptor [Flavobacteriaceae bacterium CG_4_8_14_3_um_filter_31_8]PIY15335.1 MAG: TonB-dependent receptor [Flavobacteriaceae bacterium CG_4_10_14_3_um_filter_31_253]PIZ11102.1 MAG: TonB-dependent receptor [Flavobacteriaceae bacterium CG_4_10_14_0_8_um_filter_31_99]PJC09640.1 MAG: TonB-dependent receptor 